ncbi:right-handed parallel beta-helix repeat-containing protein [Jeotgalibacillus marinus]|uniref:Right-handed parallel beta-helix repeat-containing protein n=1 Tax=Jeotgalibacillus marinus TaxID=86667 RepID=A0ABV3Q799_9BACL
MKTSKDKFSITALLLTFVGVFFIGIVIVVGIVFFNQKTLMVPDEFPEIQDAVDAAVEGDIILVKPKEDGTPYEENVEINTDNIKLIGVGKEKPVLDGGGAGLGMDLSDRSDVLVKNFRIQNFDDGMELKQATSNKIIGNTVNGSTFDGIHLGNAVKNLIKGNVVFENGSDLPPLTGIGIALVDSNSNLITGNIVERNMEHGIRLLGEFQDSTSNMVKGNTVKGNGVDGITLEVRSDENMIIGNTVEENVEDGISLSADSNENNVFVNRAFGNGDGITFFDINDQDANNFKGNKCDTSNQPNICN